MRAAIVLPLLLAACGPSAPVPAPTRPADAVVAPPPTIDAGLSDAQRAEAAQAIDDSCQMCHALDLVRAQRLSRAAWDKEIKKMIGWGAQVPPEQAAAMAALLAEQEGVDVPLPAPLQVDAVAALAELTPDPRPVIADAKKGAASYQLSCAPCHGAAAGGGPFGPSLVNRPVLYRPDAFLALVRTGLRRMPAAALDPVPIREVLAFLRAQR